MKQSLISILVLLLVSCSTNVPNDSSKESVGTIQQKLDDDSNCGAEGYACLGGRTCTDSVCLPAWQPISTTGAPTGRFAASATEFNGKYVITGGCTSLEEGSASPAAAAYDPATDTWQSLASLNHGRAFHASVTVESGTTIYGGLSTCNNTSNTGVDFEKLASMGDSSWSQISRNWDPGYGAFLVKADTDDVVMLGGGLNSPTYFEVREGSPAVFGSWSDQECYIGPGTSNIADCGRSHYIAFFDHDNENRPIVQVLGGDPSFGVPDSESLMFDIWSHQWTNPASTQEYPSYSILTHDTSTSSLSSIPVGPRMADDGQRVYVIDTSSHLHIYNKLTKTWSEDDATVPEGFCPEGPMAWVGGQLVVYSGICGGSISTVGATYQPPAPVSP